MRFRVELEKRNFISESNHVLFFYHINKKIIDCLRMVKASQFIHQPGRVVQKASYVSAADWRYQTQVKNTVVYIMLKNAFYDVQ